MKSIEKETIQKLIKDKEKFVLLNALRPDSFAKVHIPDSINIPIRLEGFDEKAKRLIPDKEQMVITYCTNYD
jgi:rhodanese-related sulfurtransferase